ncbi:MAG: ABC transporter ATP-binding protein [Bauldia sp.]|nr:ABC transporter ATP-binding protein [Bauldia sp.]MCW5717747.1 ABC transporter ATP-binding protein [Bauldia sp.]
MFRFFESRIDTFPPAPPRMPPRGMLQFVLHYSRPLLPWFGVAALLTIALSVVELMFFSFTGELVDWLASADRSTFLAEHGGRLAVMGVLIVVIFPLVVWFQSLVHNQTIFGNHSMLARWMAHRYVIDQSLSFFQNEFAGRIATKVMQTAQAVRDVLMKIVDVFVYISVFFVGTLILVGQADLLLMAPLVVWLFGYIAILVYFIPRMGEISSKQANARAELTGRIVDSYTNIQTVKLFAHSRREQDYAREAMVDFMGTVYPMFRLTTRLNIMLETLNALLLFSTGAIAVAAWMNGTISPGAIAVAVALSLRLRSTAQWIMWEVSGLFEQIGVVKDGMNTIAQPVAVTDRPGAPELVVPNGEIRFEDVTFHYGRTTGVIDDLSLTIRPGEKVGLVGRSGAGKSTLVNLLLRFFDVEKGRILIDGQDVSAVTQESLRRRIGFVTQESSLLHRSIRDNILYGSPDASQAEVEEAARKAHAEEFIATVTDPKGRTGFDAHVGERGVKLSGGQRQRVAIARVFLKNAPILVLDEATSALDSEVEAAIQEHLMTLMAGKTVIAIAHRLSTIAMLDRLIVMDGGRIVESGTHQELLERGGLYASLWQRQSGGFLGGTDERKEAAE